MKTLAIMAIPLTKGFFALVDGKNYEWLNKHKWYTYKSQGNYYASRDIRQNGIRRHIYMHREILGLCPQDGKMTDHINHCGLDNREENIRVCTNRQNQLNSRLRIDNTSGHKGVTREGSKWRASIKNNGTWVYLGRFEKKEEAAVAYNAMAKKLKENL